MEHSGLGEYIVLVILIAGPLIIFGLCALLALAGSFKPLDSSAESREDDRT